MVDEPQLSSATVDRTNNPAAPVRPAASWPADERPVIVHLQDVEKTYDIGTPRETKALRGVNLSITMSEVVVIFGASGSGKSTLLNILAGLDTPTQGMVEMDGKDLAKMTARELALYHQYKVGMVFQAYNLVDTFTVLQNISMPARLAGFKRAEYLARARDLLQQFGLEKLSDKLPSQCSGGQQQRVGIMRAFMNRPAFIIADEPTGNLDSVQSQRIMRLFKNLNEETNTTMLIVTHDPSLFEIADRVVHVLDGKITKQTILTPKAKIDEATIDVPVEYRYRSEELQQMIGAFGGSKTGPGEAKAEPSLEQQRQELEEKKTTLEEERHRLSVEEQEFETRRQAILGREQEIATARQQFEDQIKQRIAEAKAAIAKERQLLAQERTAAQRIEVPELEREKRIQAALNHITQEQALIKQERQRLLASRHEREKAQAALDQEKAKLAKAGQRLEADRAALRESRAAFEKEMQLRLSVATHIIDHEKEQLETERQKQAAEQQQRAQTMERRIASAREIIEQESTILAQEHRFLEQQRRQHEEELKRIHEERVKLQAERRRLALVQRHAEGRRKGSASGTALPSAFETLLSERGLLSRVDQKVLAVLTTLLTEQQQSMLKRAQILRLIEIVVLRLYNVVGQLEVQEMLDRPFTRGGIGLYRQAAEHLAAEIEAMIELGKLTLREE